MPTERVVADVVVVDAGVDGGPVESVEDATPVIDERIGRGTDDLATGPAMTRADAVALGGTWATRPQPPR